MARRRRLSVVPVGAATPNSQSDLPANLPPLGLSRLQAAAYIGVGSTLFDELVREGSMPPPTHIKGRRVWDRDELAAAFKALSDENGRADDVWEKVRT